MQNIETAQLGKYILKSYEIGGQLYAGLWLDTPKGKYQKEKPINVFKFKNEDFRTDWLQTKYNNLATNIELNAAYKADRKAKQKDNNEADTRQTSTLLKQYLQSKYGIKFTIKSESYTGGSSLNISWDLGPSSETIQQETERLEYGTFDGMIDLAGIKEDGAYGMVIDGKTLNTYKHVFAHRNEIANGLKTQIAKEIWGKFKFSYAFEPTNENLFEFMPGAGRFDNWAQKVYAAAQKAHFVTDQADKIKIISAIRSDANFLERSVFSYEFEGKTYTTEKPETQTPKVEKEKTIKTNQIRLLDYSPNAVAVIGKTYEIKDDLKELGGRFNRSLKINGEIVAGWVFSKSKENELADFLIEYAQN